MKHLSWSESCAPAKDQCKPHTQINQASVSHRQAWGRTVRTEGERSKSCGSPHPGAAYVIQEMTGMRSWEEARPLMWYKLDREFLLVPTQLSGDSTSNSPRDMNQLHVVLSKTALDAPGPLPTVMQVEGWKLEELLCCRYYVLCSMPWQLWPSASVDITSKILLFRGKGCLWQRLSILWQLHLAVSVLTYFRWERNLPIKQRGSVQDKVDLSHIQ